MANTQTLLQIIQFVGLIAPALAILTELLIRFHGGLEQLATNKKLPIEIQILFIGFGGILLGGMIVGIQLGLTLNNRITQIATILIFGGLPFLAIAVILMNIRISGVSDPSEGIMENLVKNVKSAISVISPLILSFILCFGPLDYFAVQIDTHLSWWIFQSDFQPIWYFYLASALFVYKVEYSLWSHNIIPTEDVGQVFENWFVSAFTVVTFFIVLSGPLFFIYRVAIYYRLPYLSETSILSAIPYLWGSIVVLALLYLDVDPEDD